MRCGARGNALCPEAIMTRKILGVACAAMIAAMLGVSHAPAATYDNLFVFGDSTVDSGWWSGALATPTPQCGPVTPPCETTGSTPPFSSGSKDALILNAIHAAGVSPPANGAPVGAGNLMNTQILATDLGIKTFLPANQPGGTNYAISGSLSAPVGSMGNLNSNTNLPSTMTQIAKFLTANPTVDPSALYLISSGGNDVTYAVDHVSSANQQTFLSNQAAALASEILALQTAGANSIVVYGLQGHGTSLSGMLSMFMTSTLFSDLKTDGVNFLGIDIAGLIKSVQADPSAYGLTTASLGVVGTATLSACVSQTGAGSSTTGWGQWCANTTTSSANYAYLNPNLTNPEQTALFSDDQHLSAKGQSIEANFVFDEITGTPVPAALPLFASGLGALGLLGWRRKRKARA
jgi:phospholipase/lecithinase/hemolysin